jgi:hypothetical protein
VGDPLEEEVFRALEGAALAEAPGDDNGMDATAANAAHADAVGRIRARASALFGPDGFGVEDECDWQPRWAGGKPRGLENQPPKVYRRQVFAVPVVSSALPAAPRLAAIVRVLVENARQTEAMFGSMPGCSACCEGCKCEIEMVRDDTRAALARAEAIAKGE